MRSWRKSVYSKICKRHQFCEKSRRNVAAAANSQICKCKCQRQQPVQRMPSFRSGSHPTSKLLHICFDKKSHMCYYSAFQDLYFHSELLARHQPVLVRCAREREGRFWWRCCCCWVATKALSLWSCYTSSQLQLLPHPWGHHIQEM